MATGPQVRDLPRIASPGKAKDAALDAPLVPVSLLIAGAYLAWFGLHYWRDQVTIWPTGPVKDVLQGKGIPAPVRSPAAATQASVSGGSGIGVGTATGEAIAAQAEKGLGVRYVWGGANPATGWDCSGKPNWDLCHALGLDIPGFKGGAFTGQTHGPNVAGWIAWNGVRHLPPGTAPQPGDLVCWGPNEHMGIAISDTEVVAAADPAEGTIKQGIGGNNAYFGVTAIVLRLKAVDTLGGSSSAAANQNTAKLLAGRYGWSPSQDRGQWDALVHLWSRESDWSVTAENPSSGAYGIPQALPGDKMAAAGADWRTSAPTQITWGLRYIRGRWRTPADAWEHEQAEGWY